MRKIAYNARALSALGHEARLSIFRLLVKAGNDGLNVGDMGAYLSVPATTLAHHLSTLVEAGLVKQQKRGREVINRVDFDVMRDVMEFLTSQCCSGVEIVNKQAA